MVLVRSFLSAWNVFTVAVMASNICKEAFLSIFLSLSLHSLHIVAPTATFAKWQFHTLCYAAAAASLPPPRTFI